MSLAVAVKGPEGIALATDSRRVLRIGEIYATYDDERKLWAFAAQPHVGAAIYGYGRPGLTLAPLHASFEAELRAERMSVEEVARSLGAFLGRHGSRLIAIVAGCDPDATARVFVVDAPDHPEPVEHHAGSVGITWGGQREFVDRLVQGYDARLDGVEELDGVQMRIPLDRINLNGSVELARFFVGTTIQAQRFVEGLGGVGGPIEMATITADKGLTWVQRRGSSEAAAEWHEIVEVAPAVTEAHPDGVRAATYAVPLANSGTVGYPPADEAAKLR